MILRSFFRKKETIIYMIILLFINIVLLSLLSMTSYLNNVNNTSYQKVSLCYVSSDKDYYSYLKNLSYIKDVRRVSFLRYNDTLIEKEALTFNYSDDVLVYENKSLKENGVVIGASKYLYMYRYDELEKLINRNISFKYNNEDVVLNIKDIELGVRGRIEISSTLFNKYLNDKYSYTAVISKEKNSNKLYDKLNEDIEGEYADLTVNEGDALEQRAKITKYVNILSIAAYFITAIFILISIIINKNIISDLEENIKMEYRLGFRKKQIRFNLLKRLLALYGITVVIPFIIMIIANIIFIIPFNIISLIIFLVLFVEILTICFLKRIKG